MQRLYSMFPHGWPGAGLLLLRLAIAAALFQGSGFQGQRLLSLPDPALQLVSVALLLGVLTPWLSMLCCLIVIAALLQAEPGDRFMLTLGTGLSAGALALLGPGAYSVDARLFGRKVLDLPAERDE